MPDRIVEPMDKVAIPDVGGELAMVIGRAAYWASLTLRMGCRIVIGAGWILRDGMTAQRAAALGPAPA
jgi:hypothetical protein